MHCLSGVPIILEPTVYGKQRLNYRPNHSQKYRTKCVPYEFLVRKARGDHLVSLFLNPWSETKVPFVELFRLGLPKEVGLNVRVLSPNAGGPAGHENDFPWLPRLSWSRCRSVAELGQ